MSLQGCTVRIIVHEPENWDKGNLFGTILSDRGGNKLLVKLTKPIEGRERASDLIELRPIEKGTTFKPLLQYYSVVISGWILAEKTGEYEYIIMGSVTID
jgi:hypothetical protein